MPTYTERYADSTEATYARERRLRGEIRGYADLRTDELQLRLKKAGEQQSTAARRVAALTALLKHRGADV